jgi:hypothetical protein
MNTVSVVVLMCRLIAGIVEPVCHEAVAAEGIDANSGKAVCNSGMAALAEWKMHSIYASDKWYIGKVYCKPGAPIVRDAI